MRSPTVAAYDSVELMANVTGFLTEINFKEGALVKKGAKLFQIDPRVYEAAVKKAKADLEKAKADRKNADLEFDRQKQLLVKDATAKRNFDLAEMNKMASAANVLVAEAQLAQAEVNLSYTQVYAPFDGWISFRKCSVGNMVGPTTGALATIIRNGDVKIYFSLSEMDMLKISRAYPNASEKEDKGPEVYFVSQDGVPYEHKGRISAWNNEITDGTGTFRIQAVCKNPDRKLIPGLYLRARLAIEPETKRVMVPAEAVMREQLGNFVYVVGKEDKIERRKISLGAKNGTFFAVLDGLKKGERVVVSGLQKAHPGQKVALAAKQESIDGNRQPAVGGTR